MSAKVFLSILTVFLIASNLSAQQEQKRTVFEIIGEEYQKDEEPKTIVEAEKILRAIQRGQQIYIKNALIVGELDISKITIEKQKGKRIIESPPLVISNSEFKDTVNFNSTIFGGYFSFNRATFNGDAYFIRATFKENALFNAPFNEAIFNGDAHFYGAIFNEDAYFNGATFNRDANFSGAIFNGDAYFNGATFNRDVVFSRVRTYTEVGGDMSFVEATFNENAYFSGVIFKARAIFGNVIFKGHAYFGEVHITADNIKKGAIFKENAHFESATFEGAAYFGKATFDNTIYFISTKFGKDLILSWEQIEGKLYYDGIMYINLVKKFKEQEQFDDKQSIVWVGSSSENLLPGVSCSFSTDV